MKILILAVIGLLGLLGSTPALAESVKMHGDFPADHREASYLQDMRVGRIGGQDGRPMEMALERALSASGHFTVYRDSYRRGPAAVQGSVSGRANATVDRRKIQLNRNVCTTKDKNGNCTKHEQRKVPCTQRTIRLQADFQVVRESDGAVVADYSRPLNDFSQWCPGDRGRPAKSEQVIGGMVTRAAGDFVGSITPSSRDYSIRFRESRKGMPKDVGNRFKDAVRMTKRDVPAACRMWTALDAQMPDNPSIVFDLGLCAESRGDYQQATALYQRASRLIGGRNNEGDTGMDRIARLEAGKQDWARFRRR